LHHNVTERLRDMIVENELPAGERIDEKALCDLFDISRTPLREALKVLASEGLVELLPNRGARVAQMTEREVVELFEVASGLECMAAELAAQRATEKELAELRRVHESMLRYYKAGRRSDYFRLNQRVHNTIIALAKNDVLTESHQSLMTRIRRARYQAIMSQERWDESVQEHEDLLAALEARDGPKAGAILRAHVLETGEAVSPAAESEESGRAA
jgi:DNA-binding GntR family transcriptional regulator